MWWLAIAVAGELQIRLATPDDMGEILDLMRLSLGEGTIPRHVDYWTWKHVDNPFGPSPCLAAVADGRLIGLRVFMRWSWCADGTLVRAVRAVDTATHPAWRGRGIFTRLTLALVERMHADGVAFVFNTPNSQSRPGYLKMGWRSVGRTSPWIRPLRPLQLIARLLSARTSAPADGRPDPARPVGSPVAELLRQPGFAGFLAALPDRRGFSTPLSDAYLRWRFTAVPDIAYRAVWSLDGADGAVVIFRFKNQERARELRLCEVLVGDTVRSRRWGRELLHDVSRTAHADYATAMAGPGSPARGVLLRGGFLPAPRLGPVMTVRPLGVVSNGLNPLRRADWHLSIGDLELF